MMFIFFDLFNIKTNTLWLIIILFNIAMVKMTLIEIDGLPSGKLT